ncbi:unnamed protein product [Echinostoma caproni]|uniref:Reverse transcriptase domain-containing protein n=1 Tax=Echinostoma caproni TaxID=27848 RepID=A0A183B5I4_9TREM|nr:unnamed protein product [Echinostoma caproni]
MGISLIPIVTKALASAIFRHLTSLREIGEQQAGFRPGRGRIKFLRCRKFLFSLIDLILVCVGSLRSAGSQKTVDVDAPRSSAPSIEARSMCLTQCNQPTGWECDSDRRSPSHHISPSLKSIVLVELRHTYDGDLARLAYVPFCRLAGGCYIDKNLYNTEWIHSLIGHKPNFAQDAPVSSSLPSANSAFTPRVMRNAVNICDNHSMLDFNTSSAVSMSFDDNAREKLNLVSHNLGHFFFNLISSFYITIR